MHSKSILPIDHWTTGLDREQLRGLVERHGVCFEVTPYTRVDSDGNLGREGWTIDFYGHGSKNDTQLHGAELARHVHDVLHTVAQAIRPIVPEGLVVEDEPFHGKVVLSTLEGAPDEVQKRVYVLRDSDYRPTLLGAADTNWTKALTASLVTLGAKQR